MASSFIKIALTDTNARFVGDLKRASDLTRQLMDVLDSIVDRGFRFLGDPAEFAEFEEAYGLPPGTGQTVFDIVNGSRIAMTSGDAHPVSLRDRIG